MYLISFFNFIIGDSNLQTLLNNMDQNQLMQLLGMTGLGGAGGGGLGGFGGEEPRTGSRNSSSREYIVFCI